jgi:hypothetical protein
VIVVRGFMMTVSCVSFDVMLIRAMMGLRVAVAHRLDIGRSLGVPGFVSRIMRRPGVGLGVRVRRSRMRVFVGVGRAVGVAVVVRLVLIAHGRSFPRRLRGR